jgi:hypothetical protein
LSADLLHLASIVLLLLKIYATKNVKGLSLKTQVLFLVVFCARYLDVFTNWRNPYNVVMKVLFLGLSGLTVYWIGWRYHKARAMCCVCLSFAHSSPARGTTESTTRFGWSLCWPPRRSWPW